MDIAILIVITQIFQQRNGARCYLIAVPKGTDFDFYSIFGIQIFDICFFFLSSGLSLNIFALLELLLTFVTCSLAEQPLIPLITTTKSHNLNLFLPIFTHLICVILTISTVIILLPNQIFKSIFKSILR